jgi:sulfite dehydrogenase (quinone) subunit SoeA
MEHVPDEAAYYKPFNVAYQDWAVKMGFYDTVQPYIFQLYAEPLRRMQLAAEGKASGSPPIICGRGSRPRWTRCRSGTRR